MAIRNSTLFDRRSSTIARRHHTPEANTNVAHDALTSGGVRPRDPPEVIARGTSRTRASRTCDAGYSPQVPPSGTIAGRWHTSGLVRRARCNRDCSGSTGKRGLVHDPVQRPGAAQRCVRLPVRRGGTASQHQLSCTGVQSDLDAGFAQQRRALLRRLSGAHHDDIRPRRTARWHTTGWRSC